MQRSRKVVHESSKSIFCSFIFLPPEDSDLTPCFDARDSSAKEADRKYAMLEWEPRDDGAIVQKTGLKAYKLLC